MGRWWPYAKSMSGVGAATVRDDRNELVQAGNCVLFAGDSGRWSLSWAEARTARRAQLSPAVEPTDPLDVAYRLAVQLQTDSGHRTIRVRLDDKTAQPAAASHGGFKGEIAGEYQITLAARDPDGLRAWVASRLGLSSWRRVDERTYVTQG